MEPHIEDLAAINLSVTEYNFIIEYKSISLLESAKSHLHASSVRFSTRSVQCHGHVLICSGDLSK